MPFLGVELCLLISSMAFYLLKFSTEPIFVTFFRIMYFVYI